MEVCRRHRQLAPQLGKTTRRILFDGRQFDKDGTRLSKPRHTADYLFSPHATAVAALHHPDQSHSRLPLQPSRYCSCCLAPPRLPLQPSRYCSYALHHPDCLFSPHATAVAALDHPDYLFSPHATAVAALHHPDCLFSPHATAVAALHHPAQLVRSSVISHTVSHNKHPSF